MRSSTGGPSQRGNRDQSGQRGGQDRRTNGQSPQRRSSRPDREGTNRSSASERPGRSPRSRDEGERRQSRSSAAERGRAGPDEARLDGPQRPRIPQDVTGTELEKPVLAELRTLPDTLAQRVAQHLVMVGRLMDEDPAEALAHALAARDLAPRVGMLRETYGIAAYSTGEYATALRELRAARRITGSDDILPIIADCERGLGRPEKALDVLSEAPQRLPAATAVELLIVGAGARRDLGDPEAAVLMLQLPQLSAPVGPDWLPRLRYAYADALAAAGRTDEAAEWFAQAEDADVAGDLEWPVQEDGSEA
jgi:tetratricopeptide (TPR) repeat protein